MRITWIARTRVRCIEIWKMSKPANVVHGQASHMIAVTAKTLTSLSDMIERMTSVGEMVRRRRE